MVQVSNLQIDNGQTPEFLKPFTLAISNQLMLEDAGASSNTSDSVTTSKATNKTNSETNNEKKTLEERIQILENIIQVLGQKVELLENSRATRE
jgi:hypothetical protein